MIAVIPEQGTAPASEGQMSIPVPTSLGPVKVSTTEASSATPAIPSRPLYELQPTDDPELFRVVDWEGDWQYYYHAKLKEYLPAVNFILGLGFPKGTGLMEWLKKMTKEEADRALKFAGERGSKIHAAIRDLIDGQTVSLDNKYPNDEGTYATITADEWACLRAFQNFVNDFSPSKIMREHTVCHPGDKYAGTTDFFGTIKLHKGQKVSLNDMGATTLKDDLEIMVVLDWKTGGGIYDDYKLQVAAYAACLSTAANHGKLYTGIVRLGTRHNSGYELKLWDVEKTKYHLSCFHLARGLFELVKPERSKDEEIPTLIKVTVPTWQSNTSVMTAGSVTPTPVSAIPALSKERKQPVKKATKPLKKRTKKAKV